MPLPRVKNRAKVIHRQFHMTQNEVQTAEEAIRRANSILIISREHPAPDTIASVAACFRYLKKEGKNVQAIIPGFKEAENLSFLSNTDEIQSELNEQQPLRISLDISKTSIDEFSYNIQDDKLNITLLPKNGEWTPSDIEFTENNNSFDLIIALDVPDKNSLGLIAQNHSDLLYQIPTINIDSSPKNTRWAQINILSPIAVSTTEILNSLFEIWNEHHIDKELATNLLAGMISKTRSFKTQDVTPKALSAASKLVAKGANRESIVHGLWRTKNIDTLQLWGRILSRLEQDKNIGLVWSFLEKSDFIETKASNESIRDLVDELFAFTPEAKIVAILFQDQKDNIIRLMLQTQHPYSANELARLFGSSGTQSSALISLPDFLTVDHARDHVIQTLKNQITSSS